MALVDEVRALAYTYSVAIKRIRVIGKDGADLCMVTAPETPSAPPGTVLNSYQRDFDVLVNSYADEVQEVRVILKEGQGASQFFPEGTPEKVVWDAIVTKEEMMA